jgi:hypothetical protein
MIELEIAFADLSDNAAAAEALLKYTFAALLNERQEDLVFFDQRIEKGLVAKLKPLLAPQPQDPAASGRLKKSRLLVGLTRHVPHRCTGPERRRHNRLLLLDAP